MEELEEHEILQQRKRNETKLKVKLK